MKKIEIIWRELLFQTIEKKNNKFTQQDLAGKFGFSTSTVNHALENLRRMGAVRVTGRFFKAEDPEKILFHWANYRNLKNDIIYATFVDQPIIEIEGLLPAGSIPTAYTAAREMFEEPPADYSKIYFYHPNIEKVKKRFPPSKKNPNLFALKTDPFLKQYDKRTTLAQTFVDLWNLSDWYAKPFVQRVKEEIDAFLS